jgi:hypothetical protein
MHHRTIWTCLLVTSATAFASVADDGRPFSSALSRTEIAVGWVFLFDGETTHGWRPVRGEVKVQNGELILGGKAETVVEFDLGFFELQWKWRWKGTTAPKREIVAIAPRELPASSTTELDSAVVGGEPRWFWERWAIVAAENLGIAQEKKFNLTTAGESRIENVFRIAPNSRVRTTITVPAGTWLAIQLAKVRPLGLQPFFNGKDLTGWKEHPGRKAKFTVNDKGELNVKDGPGDLQTEGQWDDFILQLDCISNGKHLNSGIFFRCLPGQYQQGYEAQIRNQWEGDDRTKPVDFGTGAIYRRQPARKVVSTDGQWFTMTVLARGNRFMVWVDGYLVTDFVDTRPPHENARQGAKLDKGAISIQGHDPTTDLSFRDLRIAGLARASEK